MFIVKMKSIYVYGSYPNPVLTLPSLHHSMTKILNILFSRILYPFMVLYPKFWLFFASSEMSIFCVL